MLLWPDWSKHRTRFAMATTRRRGPGLEDPSMELDDYSLYSHLSDEELVHLAIEQSLADAACPAGPTDITPSPSQPAAQTQSNPAQRARRVTSSRHVYNFPSANAPRPVQPVPSPTPSAPPPQPPRFLHLSVKEDFSPLELLIFNGDTEALKTLVRRKSCSLTEPNADGWITVHEAAHYGQLQCLRILIRTHPNTLNTCTFMGQTALWLAAAQEHVSCVEFLLERGADPNIPNKDKETPLFKACEKPNEQIVELLLKFGGSANTSCSQGVTALHEAARNGRVKICKMLVECGASIGATNVYGIQPFFTAAQNGNVDISKFLIKKGADINGQAGDGATPLFEASKNGHVTLVELLLSHKADANRPTNSGLLPLHVAVQRNHTRIVTILLPVTSKARVRHSGISPLHIAADRNRDDIMELLIESGFDVNANLSDERSQMYEDRRRTVLYFSVCNRNLEAAEMLLEAGANPNVDCFNPLLVAVRQGCIEMAMLLLRYGANVNAEISTHPSSFPSAVLLGMDNLPMLKLLLDQGCNALACFDCFYGNRPHPVINSPRRRSEELRYSTDAPYQRYIQFCEAISNPSINRWAGPIISLLLNYVGHIRLCSKLVDHLDSYDGWMSIKQKAIPPHPLMQLCRLRIRQLVGLHRLKLIHILPLPARLIRFLCYDVDCSLH
ncbi:ankyrin repeat and SOCS box protein 2-like isoform X2 [Lampris incognitus]|uniref:ankyrin repeat and SOCS box protein 2-like isoform X2 n=1 Tax=Lampris incognitus TaxID=2546036 RepID=UPI0024B55459|nr:ankyrin repeat and SOCS box protein 2-like isoform X2 [Lampris incognitus]